MNIPEGWPTKEMLKAAKKIVTGPGAAVCRSQDQIFESQFKVALAAAPAPPMKEDEPVAFVDKHGNFWSVDRAEAEYSDGNILELQAVYTRPDNDILLKALRNLLFYTKRNTCYHEETHRGGAIWEICNSCGAKWADDEGGKPAFVEPKEIKAATAILDKYSKVKP